MQYKVGDRVFIVCKGESHKNGAGTIVMLDPPNYLGLVSVRRDDEKEGGTLPGLWLCYPSQLTIHQPRANRFEVAFQDID